MLLGVHVLVREAHDFLLPGRDPGPEFHRLADVGPAMAEPIQDLLRLGAIGVDQHEQGEIRRQTNRMQPPR